MNSRRPRRFAHPAGRFVPSWTFYRVVTAPTALDIVWCRFPFIEDPNNPGPKPRPGLVRRVLRKDQHIYVEVSFGTSNPKRYSERDLYIANFNDMAECGLPQATLFLLDRTVILPWAEEWFSKCEDGSGPVIGQLNATCREYLRLILNWRKKPRD